MATTRSSARFQRRSAYLPTCILCARMHRSMPLRSCRRNSALRLLSSTRCAVSSSWQRWNFCGDAMLNLPLALRLPVHIVRALQCSREVHGGAGYDLLDDGHMRLHVGNSAHRARKYHESRLPRPYPFTPHWDTTNRAGPSGQSQIPRHFVGRDVAHGGLADGVWRHDLPHGHVLQC